MHFHGLGPNESLEDRAFFELWLPGEDGRELLADLVDDLFSLGRLEQRPDLLVFRLETKVLGLARGVDSRDLLACGPGFTRDPPTSGTGAREGSGRRAGLLSGFFTKAGSSP